MWSSLTVRLTLGDTNVYSDLCTKLSKLQGRKRLPCKFLRKKNLIQTQKDRRSLLIELDVQEYSSDFEYSPGDHIGIFPENRKK